MTEPDPLVGLAAQLEQLRGELARAQGETARVNGRLDGEFGHLMMSLLEVKQLRAELADAIEKRKLKPPPAPWLLGDEDEARALLAGLRTWVERFLRPNYPDYMTRLPACWAAHGAALWELATLRAEWDRIYADEDNRDLAGALAWHDKFLPGALGRLADAIQCTPGYCSAARPRSPPA